MAYGTKLPVRSKNIRLKAHEANDFFGWEMGARWASICHEGFVPGVSCSHRTNNVNMRLDRTVSHRSAPWWDSRNTAVHRNHCDKSWSRVLGRHRTQNIDPSKNLFFFCSCTKLHGIVLL